MPGFLTHRAAGEEVFERLQKGSIPEEKAFYLGCQGPDLLFFRNYQPWHIRRMTLRLGVTMHREKTRDLLTNVLEFLRTYDKKDKGELISYIAGFITHYSVDKNAHPFVYGKAGSNTNIHNATESMWDSYIAKERWGIEPQQFDISSDVLYREVCDGICELYSAVAKSVYDAVLNSKAVIQAQYHLAKAKEALANIRLPGKMFMKLVYEVSGFDLRNLIYPEERNDLLFTGEEYKSMTGMLEKGVDEASDMTKFMLDYVNGADVDIPDWFGDRNFAGEKTNMLQTV